MSEKLLFFRTNNNHNNNHIISTINNSRISSASSTLSIAAPNQGFITVGSRLGFLHSKTPQERRIIYLIATLSAICFILVIVVLVLSLTGDFSRNSLKVCKSKECIASAAMILQNMDTRSDPCVDFYKFACGRWLLHHPIPDSSQNTDWFLDKKTSVKREIRDMLAYSRSTEFEPNAIKQMRTLYADCINTDAIEENGLEPLRKLLEDLNISYNPGYLQGGENASPHEKFNLPVVMATAKRLANLDLLVGASVYPDPLNNTKNIFGLTAPSWKSPLPGEFQRIEWSLPTLMRRRQHLHRSKRQTPQWQQREVMLRQRYMVQVMQTVLKGGSTGERPPGSTGEGSDNYMRGNQNSELGTLEDAAKTIYTFESKLFTLANTSIIDVDFAMFSLVDLQNMTDFFAAGRTQNMITWQTYFSQLYDDTNVTVQQLLEVQVQRSYVQNLAQLLATTAPAVIEAAIWWQIIDTIVPFSIRALRELRRLYIEDLTNGQTVLTRSMLCAGVVNDVMGMAVSYMFATPSFVSSSEAKISEMLSDIRDSFVEMVYTLDWMDEETRQATLRKANAMRIHIAFPKWLLKEGALDNYYKGLNLQKKQYFENVLQLMKLFTKNMLQSVAIFNSNDNWASDPTDVNAYHSFQDNAITVPAAILQFPFFNLGMPVLNYGAIGSILAHELTHGFDNVGRLYDERGNFRPWWTNTTALEYENKTACFIEQYSKFQIPELHANVDGYLTLGENIADNGGIRESVRAYKRLKERQGNNLEEGLPGLEQFKPEQLLYLAYANLWCEQSTILATKWSLQESHAPNRVRIWGSLSNSRNFAETWQCPLHSPMNPRDKCELW